MKKFITIVGINMIGASIVIIFLSISLVQTQKELDRHKFYLQGIVDVIQTEQKKIVCKDGEDPYLDTYNTVGSTTVTGSDKDIIAIGSMCINRITGKQGSSMSIIFQNPLFDKGEGFYISGLSGLKPLINSSSYEGVTPLYEGVYLNWTPEAEQRLYEAYYNK